MSKTFISNIDDVIDSREVIKRISELEYDEESLDESDREELAALKALASECEDYSSDWRHGETLIRDSYFVSYVQELLEDIGDIPKNLPHYIAIDWDKTASNIQADYADMDYDGVKYWIRSC